MLKDLLVKERIEHELEVARQIQVGALPQVMPIAEGYDIHGWSRPAEETGGDMFDIITLPDGKIALLLADATGHGVGPALSVMQVRSMLRMCARLECELHPTFAGINKQLVEDLPRERFVTAFLGQLDPKEHRVDYISGGQGPLMHYSAATDEVRVFGPTTMPMGIIGVLPELAIESIEMAPGDILALITDGVFEAERPDGDQFEEERTIEILREHRDRSMDELVEILHDRVVAFTDGEPQADDITILLVKRLPLE
jgi:phosphoserine phosphatase